MEEAKKHMKTKQAIACFLAIFLVSLPLAGTTISKNTLEYDEANTISTSPKEININNKEMNHQPDHMEYYQDDDFDGIVDDNIPDVEIRTSRPNYPSHPVVLGTTLYVGGSGTGNYSSIQSAIDDAMTGDTVYVYDDSAPYDEIVFINKTISLVGENRATTIVDGGQREGPVCWIQAIDNVSVSGFIFQNGNSYGMAIDACIDITVDDCVFFNNTGSWTHPDTYYYGVGLLIVNSDYITVTNSDFHENERYGAHSFKSDYITVDNCNFFDNPSIGWYWRLSNYNHISNCQVYNNGGYGISAYYFDYNTIEKSDFISNGNQGLPVSQSHFNEFDDLSFTNNSGGMAFAGAMFINYYSADNNITDCEFYENNKYGIALRLSPNNIWRDNVLFDNAEGPFGFYGDAIDNFYQDIDTSNTENADPIYYYVDQKDMTLCGEPAGFVGMVSCDNMSANSMTVSGLILANTTNATISDVVVDGGGGIYIWESTLNTLDNCDPTSGFYGLHMIRAPDNTLTNCDITGNVFNIAIEGEFASDYVQSIDTTNTVNTKAIHYLVGQSGVTVPSTAGFVGLISCSDMTVENVDGYGILIVDTTGSTVSNCDFHDTLIGIYLFESSGNTISDCNAYDNSDGVNGIGLSLLYADDNTFSNCVFSYNDYAVYLEYSAGNEFTDCIGYNSTRTGQWYFRTATDNTFTRCESYNAQYWAWSIWYSSNNNEFIECTAYNNVRDGFYLYQSGCTFTDCKSYDNEGSGSFFYRSSESTVDNCEFTDNGAHGIRVYYSAENNTITNCDITGNGGIGVYIYRDSINNVVHHNNIMGNAQNGFSDAANVWDDSTGEGNHWGDYTGEDADMDGIGDTAYAVPGDSNVDNYPMMCPYGSDTTAPEITIESPTTGLYLFGRQLIPLPGRIIAIGGFTLEINVTDECSVVLVEFYADGELVASDETGPGPYTWDWNIRSFFAQHTLEVKGYDRTGNSATEELTLRVFSMR